jgi:hypothetical protein
MKTYRHTQRANCILIAPGVTAAALAITGGLFLRPVLITGPLLLLSGWLDNVSGFDAVAIQLSNGRQFCVGTDEPEKLQGHLRA